MTISFFLLIILFVIWMFFYAYKKEQKIKEDFNPLPKTQYFFIKYIFLILAFLSIFLSIFWLKTKQNVAPSQWKWMDIIFALDVSKSMNVIDIFSNNSSYSRLEFAKGAISDFVSNNLENRYSLVIFAWDAISVVPLTNDKNVFLTSLKNVDYRNLPNQGSNFSEAFNLANDRTIVSSEKSKAVIFISDGWDDDDLINTAELSKLKLDYIEYFIVWVWTEEGWKIISWQDIFGRLTYQTYNWEYVISKLNEKNLKIIADTFNWEYLKLGKYSDINLFSKNLDKIEKKVIETNDFEDGVDASRNLSFISFLFFLLYLGLHLFETESWKHKAERFSIDKERP